MPTPILRTKLFVPPPRTQTVLRPRLIAALNEGLNRRLTVISAPAGFGKTSLVAEWVAGCGRPAAWLSLDGEDGDPARFLTYLVAALQTLALSGVDEIAATIGNGVLGRLQAPQPPPLEALLTALLNDIAAIPRKFVLVLDDYHLVEAKQIDSALAFLVEHLPPQMHLLLTTREDPNLPLARLRARGQLTELRAADLRFTLAEAASFLGTVMGLNLTTEDVSALEARTEGWIAGLQLAAISMQGNQDAHRFISSFAGTHHFVLDYLVEEVLHRQSERIQAFLLRTSILDRMCGPLCDAVLRDTPGSGQQTLEFIEHANLFLVPLDNERRWYRYHQLFADLLRQRLRQSAATLPRSSVEDAAELHARASAWHEENGLELEAFQHAAAANDVARAERLIEGKGIPLPFRGAGAAVLRWLALLPTTTLDARPALWVTYASTLLFGGQPTAVEQKLQAGEAALAATLQGAAPSDGTADLLGRIASMRATLAVIQHDVDTIIAQSRRALAYLRPDNVPIRTAATWSLGFAYQLQGDRAAAGAAYAEVIANGRLFGNSIYTIAATINLGQLQEADNQLSLAATTYKRGLELVGDGPQRIACEAHLGLARIAYQQNDLEAALAHGQLCLNLTQQMEGVDTVVSHGIFLARLKMAHGDAAGAAAVLAEAETFARQHGYTHQLSAVAAAQVQTLLQLGNLPAAAYLAGTHGLPISLARVRLAQGDASAALAALEPWRRRVEIKGWADEQLRVMLLQAVAHQALGEIDEAAAALGEALALAEPNGFVRLFVDEGAPMAQLLSAAAASGIRPDYVAKLLAAFDAGEQTHDGKSSPEPSQALIEPLSPRELEVLRLIAQGLSNSEIGEKLFLALSTVKGHNRVLFGKLQAQRRTEAIARARELGLL